MSDLLNELVERLKAAEVRVERARTAAAEAADELTEARKEWIAADKALLEATLRSQSERSKA